MDRIDIAIIGGGVIGSAIAFNVLALRPELSVLVIERDPTYRTASSALSASSIRQQFSTPANIAMSRYSLAFLKDIETHLTVAGDVPDINLVERGYLCLATDLGKPSLERNHALQLEHNVDVDLLDPQQLGKQFPWLFTGDLAAGSLGRSGEGWFDGYSLLQAFRRKARALGATYVSREVIGIKLIRGRVDAVTLSDGSRIGCGKLVNAAGPWARGVAKLAGIDLPVHAAKHCIFVFDCKDSPAACPLVIDPSGVYFRPEGQGFIAGAPAQKDSPAQNNLDVDYRQFDEVVWPVT